MKNNPYLIFLLFASLSLVYSITENQNGEGYFSTYSTSYSTNFNNWINETSNPQNNISYFFYTSGGIQTFETSDIANFSAILYDNRNNNSVSVNIDMSHYDSDFQQWHFNNGVIANITFFSASQINSSYKCQIYGTLSISAFLGQSSVSLYGSGLTPECQFQFSTSNNLYVYHPAIIPIFLVFQYILVIVQIFIACILIKDGRSGRRNMRTLSIMSFIFLYGLIICKVVTIYRLMLTNTNAAWVILMIFNLIFAIALNRIIYGISFLVIKNRFLRGIFYLIFNIFLLVVLLGAFQIYILVWSYFIFPTLAFIAQTVRNYIHRNTHVKIDYPYYIGIIGASFIPPLYYFICPNIFLIEVSFWKAGIWCTVVGLMIVAFILEFKFFFKPHKGYNQEFIETFDYLFSQKINDQSLICKQDVRLSRVVELRDAVQGAFQKSDKDSLLYKLLYQILSIDKAQLVVKQFEKNKVPDCSVCYQLVTDIISDPGIFNKDQFKDLVLETKCHHFFHFQCMIEWLAKTKDCPLCRKKIECLSQSNIIKVKIQE